MFILFFGTRPGKTREQMLKGVRCSYCGQTDTLIASVTPNYFHLFWIPLFRVATMKTAHCTHCKRGYYQEDFTEAMDTALLR